MLSNLNERYLLKFISNANTSACGSEFCIIEVLRSCGIKIKFNSTNPVYDIIDKLEYAGSCYE